MRHLGWVLKPNPNPNPSPDPNPDTNPNPNPNESPNLNENPNRYAQTPQIRATSHPFRNCSELTGLARVTRLFRSLLWF